MNPTCDLCGREMLWLDQSLDLDGRVGWVCPATPDQHRIAELEAKLAKLTFASLGRLIPQTFARWGAWQTGEVGQPKTQLSNAKKPARKEPSMANEPCPKCGTEMVLQSWISMATWKCSLHPKDCRIKELESQLRAREAEVLALREWITTTAQHPAFCRANFNGEACTCGKSSVLSSTSATAQEIVARIKREVVNRALAMVDKVEGDYPKDIFPEPEPGCSPDRHSAAGARLACRCIAKEIRAAILGEKEKP